jgi:hypothetical protein
MKTNFTNIQFEWLFKDISSSMPKIIFTGIILTYMITAALNVYFLPLPLLLSIPASIMLQFGRFAVVFIDFLNPSPKRSKYPAKVAGGATVVALAELFFSIQGDMVGAEFWATFLFIGAIICFGYVLEIQFIEKGLDAYGIGVKQPRSRKPAVKQPARDNVTATAPIKFAVAIALTGIVTTLSAQENSFMAYNWMSVKKISKDSLHFTYYNTEEDIHSQDTIPADWLNDITFWDSVSRENQDNDIFMHYGTQILKYNKSTNLWRYKGKYYNYIEVLFFMRKYARKNFLNKKVKWQ